MLDIDPNLVEERQIKRLRQVKSMRDNSRVETVLNNLRSAARRGENIIPYVLEAVKAYATEGEIMNVLKEVFGVWTEPILY